MDIHALPTNILWVTLFISLIITASSLGDVQIYWKWLVAGLIGIFCAGVALYFRFIL